MKRYKCVLRVIGKLGSNKKVPGQRDAEHFWVELLAALSLHNWFSFARLSVRCFVRILCDL